MWLDPGYPTEVLLIARDPQEAEATSALFLKARRHKVRVHQVDGLAGAQARLLQRCFDLAICDADLPDGSAHDFLQSPHRRAACLPVIVLADTLSVDQEREWLNAGAMDALPRANLRPDLLARSIHYALGRSQQEQEMLRTNILLQQALDRELDSKVVLNAQNMLMLKLLNGVAEDTRTMLQRVVSDIGDTGSAKEASPINRHELPVTVSLRLAADLGVIACSGGTLRERQPGNSDLVGRHIHDVFASDEREKVQQLIQGADKGICELYRLTLSDACRNVGKGSVLAACVPIRGPMAGPREYLLNIYAIGLQSSLAESLFSALGSDPLTGLANRRRLERTLRDLANSDTAPPYAVFCIDMDFFKQINDTHGHDVGDQVLLDFAARLTASVRSSDLVARSGGDEFVVVCPGVGSAEHASNIGRSILKRVRERTAEAVQGLALSCSIGSAVYPQNGSTPAEVLKAADLALYEAKRAGRSCHRAAAQSGVDIARPPRQLSA